MSTEVGLRIGGAAVFWSLGTSNRQKIQAAFEQLDLKEYTPDPKTPSAALRHALAEVYKGQVEAKNQKVLVRPLEGGEGFAVVRETKGEQRNEYEHLCCAKVESDSGIEITPYPGHDTLEKVTDEYSAAMASISASSMSSALVKILEGMNGLALRPSGGVYWLNKTWLTRWQTIAQYVEKSATEDSDSKIYSMTVIADEGMVKAVGDALTEEIREAVEAIEGQVTSPEMTVAVCERHVKKTAQLRSKVEAYESCFRQPLTALTELLDQTIRASAMAALKASAASVAQQQARSSAA